MGLFLDFSPDLEHIKDTKSVEFADVAISLTLTALFSYSDSIIRSSALTSNSSLSSPVAKEQERVETFVRPHKSRWVLF